MPRRHRKKPSLDVNRNAVRVDRLAGTGDATPPAMTKSDVARGLGKLGASKRGQTKGENTRLDSRGKRGTSK
jgi:hypothetical protein